MGSAKLFDISAKAGTIARRSIFSIGVCAGLLLVTSCGGSDGESSFIIPMKVGDQSLSSLGEVLDADECAARTDGYRSANLRGLGEDPYSSVDELLDGVSLKDGRRLAPGMASSVEVELSDSQKQQIWDSYQKTIQPVINEDKDFRSGAVNAYGDGVEDEGGYDGKLDEGLNLCVTLSYFSGTPKFK